MEEIESKTNINISGVPVSVERALRRLPARSLSAAAVMALEEGVKVIERRSRRAKPQGQNAK